MFIVTTASCEVAKLQRFSSIPKEYVCLPSIIDKMGGNVLFVHKRGSQVFSYPPLALFPLLEHFDHLDVRSLYMSVLP